MTRKRKREKKPPNRLSALHPKRLRPATDAAEGATPVSADEDTEKRGPFSLVVVTGLPLGCTVLELKSRLEMYGPISRIRIDADGAGYVIFRSVPSAEAAVSAALDPDSGVLVRSQRVQVCRGTDPFVQWRMGVRISSPSSLHHLVFSKNEGTEEKLNVGGASAKSMPALPPKDREMVAYDDLF